MKTVIEINPVGAVLKVTCDWEIKDGHSIPLKEEAFYMFRISDDLKGEANEPDVIMALIERSSGILWAKFFKELWTNVKHEEFKNK